LQQPKLQCESRSGETIARSSAAQKRFRAPRRLGRVAQGKEI